MELASDLFSPAWLILGHLLYWPVLLRAARRAPWRRLRDNEFCHVLLGACVGLLVIWQIRAGLPDEPSVHLLGGAILVLMFGWEWAVLGLSGVLLASVLTTPLDWSGFGLNGCLSVLLPIWVSFRFALLVRRWLPGHFFIYIFVSAFVGGALAMAAVGLASTALLLAAEALEPDRVLGHYAPLYLLLFFPEGFLTGLVLTLLVAYRPRWVASFDDARYLHGK